MAERFVILADESANWQIAGLSQLHRLVLVINEFLNSDPVDSSADIRIFWKPETPLAKRWLPPGLENIRYFEEDNDREHECRARILSTRLLVSRGALSHVIADLPFIGIAMPGIDERLLWDQRWRDVETACHRALARPVDPSPWQFLNGAEDIPQSEKTFLRTTGKPQDGIVSRYLNRPISRSITRILLRHQVSPAAWTLSMLILPVLSSLVMLRGDYVGLVIGVAIFQIYSIVDGCDGEIARAKYLESEKGGRLDTWTDISGGFIFIFGLGYGLYRKHSDEMNSWRYLAEAIACVIVIAANEWRLRGGKSRTDASANAVIPTLYPRHHELIHHSGILLVGEKLVWWLVQFTKRDISIFAFFVLAIAARPEWILPIWIAATAIVLLLAETARWKRSRSSFELTAPS